MIIVPDWKTPRGVKALMTTRAGGVSQGAYDSLNLATHVGDSAGNVADNRSRVRRHLPAEPLWLEQVHGVEVARFGGIALDVPPCADAAVAFLPAQVCVVMTADCLPVLFASQQGDAVAAAHAGWRGLLDGVLEETVSAMQTSPDALQVWLGPAIGPTAFEVGDEVRNAFINHDACHASAFVVGAQPGKWMADLFILARQRLARLGVSRIEGGGVCTWHDARRFYSYRRDGQTGRFATMIWIEA